MKHERWVAIETLFAQALAQPASERRIWLSQRCQDDPELAMEVASLLDADKHNAVGLLESDEIAADVGGSTLVSGTQGRFRLLERLAEGGTSTVYLATTAEAGTATEVDTGTEADTDEQVAVKILRGDGKPGLVARFATEVEVLSQLDHPGIARLVDAGTTDGGRPFVVTELIQGEPIDRFCARHRLPLQARLMLFGEVCEAMQAAHGALVLHRDLKPGNILVNEEGKPVLLDFGLARLFDSQAALDQGGLATETRNRMLTLSSASPEQIRGTPLTTATDVYGLGVLLYHLLTGRAPFAPWHDRPAELARVICEVDPELPSQTLRNIANDEDSGIERPERWSRHLRGDLDAIVAKALRKKPARRYISVERLADDVRRHLQGRPVRARRAGLLYRAGKLLRRHRLAAATVAALTLGLLLASVTAVVQERRMARERERAELSLDFLIDVLSTADPARGGGKNLTARQILDTSAARIRGELEDQPAVQARLLNAIGYIYLTIGAYEAAEAALSQALDLRQALYGDTPHLETATSLVHLGDVNQELGRHQEAEMLYRRSLAQRRRLLGEDDLLVAGSLTRLADAQRDQGAYDEAEDLYRQALALRRDQLGESHLDVAETLNNLGVLYQEKGDRADAEERYRQALALRQQLLAGDHPALVHSLQNLASVLEDQRRFDEAAPLFEEALGMAQRLYGAAHVETAGVLQNLAALHLNRGDSQRAEPLLRQALAIHREQYGGESSYSATNLYSLGLTKELAGDLEAAKGFFRQAADIYSRTLGPDHPWLAFPLYNLGRALTLTDPAEAKPLLERSIAIRRTALGDDHWRVAEVEVAYGWCLYKLGQRKLALPLLKGGWGRLQDALPAGDPRIADAAEHLERATAAP